MAQFSNKLCRGAHLCALGLVLASSFVLSARADTLAAIKKNGVVTVGTEAAFPPFEFVKDGKIVGYGKDILDDVVAGLGVKLNQLDVPYDGIFPGLLAGKFDFIATTLLITEADAKRYAFTYPIAEGSSSIMIRKSDTRINSPADLDGKTVGAQVGTASAIRLRAMDAKWRAEGKPGMNLKLFTSGPEGFVALANNQIDAVVSLLPVLRVFANKHPDQFKVVGLLDPKQHEYLGWATRADDTRLRDYISARIKALRDSGKLYQLQDKWFHFRMTIPESGYMPPGAI